MRQKEIWMVDLSPVIGSEQGGLRPAVIISGDKMNTKYKVVIVCPLTSQIKPYLGCPILKPNKQNNLRTDSQAIPFQVRSISKLRLIKNVGFITEHELSSIKEGLDVFLKY